MVLSSLRGRHGLLTFKRREACPPAPVFIDFCKYDPIRVVPVITIHVTPNHPGAIRAGIITALKLEARPLNGYPNLAVRVCGVAGPGVAHAVRELGEMGSQLIVSWGTAGALSGQLRAGDLMLPESVITRAGEPIATDAGYRQDFRRGAGAAQSVASGILVESSRILSTPEHKRRVGRDNAAQAVDMESGRIGEACAASGLPFLVVRAIVDELDDRLPRQSLANISPHGSLRAAPLLANLIRYPGEWAPLARLALRYRRARTALDAAARAVANLG